MPTEPVYNSELHHRRSIRIPEYDYSKVGMYFMTICCQDMVCRFGSVEDGKMVLNESGRFAQKCWEDIPIHFPEVRLHAFVIMPNHIHGIIEITENVGAKQFSPNKETDGAKDVSPVQFSSETEWAKNVSPVQFSSETEWAKNVSPLQMHNTDVSPLQMHNTDVSPVQMQNTDVSPLRSPSKTIGSIVRGYKIGVTKWVRQNTNIQKLWQRNYYEHVIRNEYSFQRISEYIFNNPAQWEYDTLYRL